MFKKLIYTITSKLWSMLAMFSLIWLSTKYLGAEGRGVLSNWMASLQLLTQIGLCFGGPALVYFSNKYLSKDLLKKSIVYGLLVSIFSILGLYIYYQELNLAILIAVALLLQLLIYAYIFLLTGVNHIRQVNNINNINVGIHAFGFLLICLFNSNPSTISYLYMMILSSVITLSLAFYIYHSIDTIGKNTQTISHLNFLRKNIISQLSNIFQMLNYRVSYFIIPFYLKSYAELGVYSVAIALGEAIWLVGKSIALINLGNIASGSIDQKNIKLSVYYSIIVTIVSCFILYMIPQEVFIKIFGIRFFEVKHYLINLFPGFILCSIQFVPAAYFAGKGDFVYNNIAAFIGFIITVIFNYLFVPDLKVLGAVLAFNVSMTISSIILFLIFIKKINLSVHEKY